MILNFKMKGENAEYSEPYDTKSSTSTLEYWLKYWAQGSTDHQFEYILVNGQQITLENYKLKLLIMGITL